MLIDNGKGALFCPKNIQRSNVGLRETTYNENRDRYVC